MGDMTTMGGNGFAIRKLIFVGDDDLLYEYCVLCRFSVDGIDYITLFPTFDLLAVLQIFRCSVLTDEDDASVFEAVGSVENDDGSVSIIGIDSISDSYEFDKAHGAYVDSRDEAYVEYIFDSIGVEMGPPLGFITLVDADGKEIETEIVANFHYNGMDIFGLLFPNPDEDGNIVIGLYGYRGNADDPNDDTPIIYEIPAHKYDIVYQYFSENYADIL